MAKKEDNQFLYVIGILLVAVIALKGGGNTFFETDGSGNEAPLEPETEYYQYDVMLNLDPSHICVGSSTTGSITTNIDNGFCSIFVDTGSGMTHYKNVLLDSSGDYSESQTMYTTGTATFRAVCCDAEGNCRISNDDRLFVENCVDCAEKCTNEGFSGGYGPVEEHTDCELVGEGGDESAIAQEGWDGWCCCYNTVEDGDTDEYTCGYDENYMCGGTCPSGQYCMEILGTQGWYCDCVDEQVPENTACESVALPEYGDLGGICRDEGYCSDTADQCSHYWDYITQEHKCGCTETYYCGQYCYEYYYTEECVCPPNSHQVLITRSTYVCEPDGCQCYEGEVNC